MTKPRKRRKPLMVTEMAKLGGKTRMAQLSPENRTELGKKAAAARWSKRKPPK